MTGHGLARSLLDGFGIARAFGLPVGERPAPRQIAVNRIMRGGLVGQDVGAHVTLQQVRQNIGRVAEQADRKRCLGFAAPFDDGQRLIEVFGLHVEILGAQAHLDAARLAFDGEARGPRHDGGERLRATHAAEARGQDPLARQRAAVVLPAGLDECLVGSLHDPLRADIDPRPGRHLAVHHQAFAIELVELFECRPMRHEVGVGDQDARRVRVRAKHADGLAGLHKQRLVGFELAQARNDAVETVPVAGSTADAAVDDELTRLLRHLRIEVVHEHAHRRFRQPALGAQFGATRGAYASGVVDAVHGSLLALDRVFAETGQKPVSRGGGDETGGDEIRCYFQVWREDTILDEFQDRLHASRHGRVRAAGWS